MNKETINGYGQIFRFITPTLVSVAIFLLTILLGEVKELKSHFTNHLSEHKQIEIFLEKRLTYIETILKNEQTK